MAASGAVVFGAHDGVVRALDANANGALLWSYTTAGVVYAAPLLSLDLASIFVGSGDGHLYKLDAEQRQRAV